MRIERDFSQLSGAGFWTALWNLPLPKTFVWRLERLYRWLVQDELLASADQKVGHTDHEAGPGLAFAFSIPPQSIGLLQELIIAEVERRTPFSGDNLLVAYDLAPEAGAILVTVSVCPDELLEQPVEPPKAVMLAGGLSFVAPATAPLKTLTTSAPAKLLLLALALSLATGEILNRRALSEKQDIEADMRAFQSDARAAAALRDEFAELRATSLAAKSIYAQQASRITIISELSELLPKNVWLTRMDLQGDIGNIRGTATSAAAVVDLIETSELFTSPRFTAPISVTEQGLESFALEFKILLETAP